MGTKVLDRWRAGRAILSGARKASDKELADACRRGDQGVVDTLVQRYKDRLYNVAYGYLGNREEALLLAGGTPKRKP